MVYIAIIVGCILGALIGSNAPVISYTYSSYLSIAIIAAIDSVFGGISIYVASSSTGIFTISFIFFAISYL